MRNLEEHLQPNNSRNKSSLMAEIKVPVAYDIFKLCENICDRWNQTCFDPRIAILVYTNATTDQMRFRQLFSPYVKEKHFDEILSDHKNKLFTRRTFCSIDDVEPFFTTITKQRKCAVVGNSGIVLKSKCGKEIDSHDFVMRANLALLEGYTDYVGNKTSLMMINDETLNKIFNSLVKSSSNEGKAGDLRGYIANHLKDSILWFAKGTEAHNSAARLQQVAQYFEKHNLNVTLAYSMGDVSLAAIRRWHVGSYPSSGLDMLTVAETFCESIALYGFYPYDKDRSGFPVFHHYYEPNLKEFHTTNHNFDKEYKLLQDLHKKGFIRLVYDHC